MNPILHLSEWLNIRRHEFRTLLLSFLGAFLVIGFLIMARSLREALYLTSFDVKTLPYITITVAILGLPTVGLFTRLLARYDAQRVLRGILVIMAIGLALLWPLLGNSRIAVVVFYLWTALGTLVITSGFWVATSEHFPLRSAKRLFALISAGGTAGAMVIGTSLSWMTKHFDIMWLIPFLIIILVAFFLIEYFLPSLKKNDAIDDETKKSEKTSIRKGLSLVWNTPHLRLIGLIVATATMATTLLDYQFKELVRGTFESKEALTGFFGAFYGWTGFASLVIQLGIASRLLSATGVGVTLAVLPLILLLGSSSFLLIPSLLVVTIVRGADNSLRKSLHRAVLEVLYVPVPSLLRRKTKTFIDSVVDSLSEGLGAGLIFLWVTMANYSSRYLSFFIMGLALFFIGLCKRMDKQYLTTLKERLLEGADEASEKIGERFDGHDLLSATFTFIDLKTELKKRGLKIPTQKNESAAASEPITAPIDPQILIRSSDMKLVAKALHEGCRWNQSHVPDLTRLVTKDALYHRVCDILTVLGEEAVTHLAYSLLDEEVDFVIRRRLPRILARIDSADADTSLLKALTASRFEVRYRSAIALMRRRKSGLKETDQDWKEVVWEAIRHEVTRDKPVWEMQRLLDSQTDDEEKDVFVEKRIGVRGELSLEHTFRLLALALDAKHVQTAFHGLLLDDEKLKSFALEYLEHVLPPDIHSKLWPFIGDISEYQRQKASRPLEEVVSDLMTTGATLFGSDAEKKALKKVLQSKD